MIYFNVVLLDLENSDIAAVSFLGTKTKKNIFRWVLDPSNFKFSDEEHFKLEGSNNEYFVLFPSILTAAMSECSKSRRTILKSIIKDPS